MNDNSPPDDIRPRLYWHVEGRDNGVYAGHAVVNPDAHNPGCRVFWGSHGCDRPHGHDGPHWCSCCACEHHPDLDSGCVGGPPYYGPDTTFSGEDA